MGLPCYKNCAYRGNIPGDAHITCQFDWKKATREEFNTYPTCQSEHAHQWFTFPINYDPAWGPEECPCYSTERDLERYDGRDPLERLMEALMG